MLEAWGSGFMASWQVFGSVITRLETPRLLALPHRLDLNPKPACFFFFHFCFCSSVSWVLLGKTLFSYGISVISLGFAWCFIGKPLFSYGFRVISLGFFWCFVGKTLFSYGCRVISLGFQKENIR